MLNDHSAKWYSKFLRAFFSRRPRPKGPGGVRRKSPRMHSGKGALARVGIVFATCATGAMVLAGAWFFWCRQVSQLSHYSKVLPASSFLFTFEQHDKNSAGFKGLFSLDLDTQQLVALTRKVNDVYRIYSEVLENAEDPDSQDPDSAGVLPNFESEPGPELELGGSPFDEPVKAMVDEIWNGKAFTLGSILSVKLPVKQTLSAGLHQFAASSPDTFLRNIFGLSSFAHVDTNSKTGVHHGLVQLHISDLENFVDMACSEKDFSLNICDRFGMSADSFLTEAQNWLGMLGDDFHFQLHFYWKQKGTAIIWSNQEANIHAAGRRP